MLPAPLKPGPAGRSRWPFWASLGWLSVLAIVLTFNQGLPQWRSAAEQIDPLSEWRLRYPVLPSFGKVVPGSGVFVALSDVPPGVPYLSRDGMEWTEMSIDCSEQAALSDIGFGNEAFYAVTESGEVFSSVDGTDWMALSITAVVGRSASSRLRVAAGNGIIVIVSEDGWVATSADGLAWSLPEQLEGRVDQLFFGGGLFLALMPAETGEDSTVLASADGLTWDSLEERIGGTVTDVSFSNGMFVAVSSASALVVSYDGANWFELGSIPLDEGSRPVSVLFGGNRFLALVILRNGDAQVLVSLNGVDWSPQLNARPPNGLVYGNGVFVLYGTTTYTSSNGVRWDSSEQDVLSALPTSVAFGHGRFVAVGGNRVLLSFDGVTWTPVEITGTQRLPTGIYYAGGMFLAPSWPEYDPVTRLPMKGCILLSTDGVAWTEHLGPPVLSSLRHFAHGNGRFVAVGEGTHIYASDDGVNWSKQADTEVLTQILFGNGVFLASAYRPGPRINSPYVSYVYRSSDALTWTKLPFEFDGSLTLRLHAGGVFVANAVVSPRRIVMTSRNGDQWTSQFSGINTGLVSNAHDGAGAGHFVMLTPSAVLSSVDTTSWWERPVDAAMSIAEEALHPASAFGSQTFVTVVRGRIQQSGPITPPHSVSVSAEKPEASDWGPDPGRLKFTRSETSPLSVDLPVQFALSGTAVEGEDYHGPETPAIIPAGERSVSVEITPISRPLEKTNKTVITTLVPADDYLLEEPTSATLTINYVGSHPRFSPGGVSLASDGSVHLVIESVPGAEIEVQTSADLATWSALTNVISPTGLILFIDPPSAEPFRFYRTVPPESTSVLEEKPESQ